MIKIYLESSALWDLHYTESGRIIVEHVLQQPDYQCSSSAWSQVELLRSVQKRMNQKEITPVEAADLRAFIEANIKELTMKRSLELLQITAGIIDRAKMLIVDLNLYSADAVHLATALIEGCSFFLADDYHFERLNEIVKTRFGISILSTSIDIASLPTS